MGRQVTSINSNFNNISDSDSQYLLSLIPLSLFHFLFKTLFYLVYLSTPPKKDKEYDAKNGFCFFSEYLVSEGGNLFPQKITCI